MEQDISQYNSFNYDMGNYKLISVESRKGGVGKTTAALNLGCLLKDRYHVLLLDIDITGTSISAIKESRFWKNDTHLLTGKDGIVINLLQYFTNSYLKGEELLDFTLGYENDRLRIIDGAINVIASELYSDDASLLYDPAILLENLHVYWLTKMITEVCERFEKCFDDNKQCVIILDNSPGFVGIGKAVHDIMTDIGPEKAKFLTVSSLDIQDLESSLKSVYSIHQQYLDKLYGSRYPESHMGDENFYAQVQLSGVTEYVYYKQDQKEASIPSYQALIINKVAKSILEGRQRYDYHKSLPKSLHGVFEGLYGDDIKDYMVPFDRVISTQFYGVLVETNKKERSNLSTLKKRLNTIEWQIKMLDELGPDLLPYDLLRRAEGFDKTIDTLKGALIASGYEVIASKINPDWSPTMPLRDMIVILKEAGFSSDTFEFYVPKRNRMEREMVYFQGIAAKASYYAEQKCQDYVWLASAVASVACELSFSHSNKILWSNNRTWRNDEIVFGESKENWANMVNYSLSMWMERIVFEHREEKEQHLTSFILSRQACAFDGFLKDLFDQDDFVLSVKNAIARLIDLESDMQTLVNLIRIITVNNDGNYSLDVDFVSFLNKKIIEKRYDYIQAKQLMYSELKDSDYMAFYQKVLNNVICNWSL